MKFNTLTRRAAAAGGATALAAGALVGFTATSASAAVGPITYSCPTALGTLPVTLASTDIPDLPGVAALGPYAAGSAVPAGQAPNGVKNHFVISNATKQALGSVGTTNIHFTSFKGAFGNSFVPAVLPDVATSSLHDDGDGNWSFDANGSQGAFNNPKAGTWDVFAPTSFSFVATTGAGPVPVTCTADNPSTPSYGSQIVVVKNDSATKGSSNSPVKHGAKAVLKAKVTAPNHQPTGTVVFKEGAKKLGSAKLKKGVATLTKALTKGKHKIKAYYGGDGYTNKSTSSVFTVTQK